MSNDANVSNNVIDTNGIESFVLVEKSELNQIVKDPVQCDLGASHGQKVSVKSAKCQFFENILSLSKILSQRFGQFVLNHVASCFKIVP